MQKDPQQAGGGQPARRSNRTETIAARLQREKEKVASLPHVLKDEDRVWE